jgi:hypothetical protein
LKRQKSFQRLQTRRYSYQKYKPTLNRACCSRCGHASGQQFRAPASQDHLELLRSSNPHFAQTGDPAHLKILPGLTLNKIPERARQAQIVRAADPTDFKSLSGNIEHVGRQVVVAREDGFEALKTFCRRRPRAPWCCATQAMK